MAYDSDPMIADLVWSDPSDRVMEYTTNRRGSGVLFGAEAVKNFLANTGLKLLIRAHQVVPDGFALWAQNIGMTLFSSSEYCHLIHNRCGIVYAYPRGKVDMYSISPEQFDLAVPKVTMALGEEIGLKRIFPRLNHTHPVSRDGKLVVVSPGTRNARLIQNFGGKLPPMVNSIENLKDKSSDIKSPRLGELKIPMRLNGPSVVML
jgi:hypothetical protein